MHYRFLRLVGRRIVLRAPHTTISVTVKKQLSKPSIPRVDRLYEPIDPMMSKPRAAAGTDATPEPDQSEARQTAALFDRGLGAAMSLAIVLSAVAVAPFAQRKAADADGLLAIVTAIAAFAFALSASLLYAQYRANRHIPCAILSFAYGAAAALLVPLVLNGQLIADPNAAHAMLAHAARTQTASWFEAFQQILFCALVIVSVALECPAAEAIPRQTVRTAALTVALIVAATVALCTQGQAWLPRLVENDRFTPMYWTCVLPLMFGSMFTAGAVVISPKPTRTRAHLWLAVILIAMLVETTFAAFLSAGPGSYGRLFARAELAVSAIVLLVMLQSRFTSVLRSATRARARSETLSTTVTALGALQDAVAAAFPSRAAVVAVILDFARRETGATASVLEIAQGDEMIYEAATGALAPFVGTRLDRKASLSGACSRTMQALTCADTAIDPRVDRMACLRFDVGSMILMPISLSAEQTAVLKVTFEHAFAFGEREIQLVTLAAKHLGFGLLATHEFATHEQLAERAPPDRREPNGLRGATGAPPSGFVGANGAPPSGSRGVKAALTESAFTDTPTLGIATLLEIFDGNVASVREIFAAARASIDVDLGRIQQAISDDDMRAVAEAAHRMKGTSGSIRSLRITEVSGAIQAAAKAAEAHAINPSLLLDLGSAVAEFRTDLDAFHCSLTTANAS